MRLVTDFEIDELIRIARLRTVDERLTLYTRDQAHETIAALEELKLHRRSIPVEGIVREGQVEHA